MLVGVDCRVANVETGIAHEVGSERRRGACHLWLAIPSYCGHWCLCNMDSRGVVTLAVVSGSEQTLTRG